MPDHNAIRGGHRLKTPGRDFWIVAGVLAAVRSLHLAAYPLMIEGDGITYFRAMLLPFRSHLLHPPGYPFLFGFVPTLARLSAQPPAGILRPLQMFFSMLPFLVVYLGLRKHVGIRWAAAVTLIVGCDFFQVSSASVTRPEFCQVATLLLMAGTLLLAEGKVVYYLAGGALFGLSYVVKFNSLAFFPLLLLPLFDRTLTKRQRVGSTAGAGASALAFLVVFLVAFHQPSTKTWKLNLEHGVIHLKKLLASETPVAAQNGIATQKFLLAMSLLPKENPFLKRDPFGDIEAVSAEAKAHLHAVTNNALRSENREEVRRAYEAAGSSKFTREMVEKVFDLYRWLGLSETETLIKEVLKEAVRRKPLPYVRHTFATLFSAIFDFTGQYEPVVPVVRSSGFPFPRLYENEERPNVIAGRAEAAMPVIAKKWDAMDYLGRGSVQYELARLLSLFAWPLLLPPLFVWLCLVLAVFVAGRSFPPFVWLSAASVLLFVSGSSALFLFRNKEYLVFSPFLFGFFLLSIRQLILTMRGLRSTQAKVDKTADEVG